MRTFSIVAIIVSLVQLVVVYIAVGSNVRLGITEKLIVLIPSVFFVVFSIATTMYVFRKKIPY